MSLENAMLSEQSHTQKATYCVILLIRNVQNRQIHTDTEAGRREGRELLVMDTRCLSGDDENVPGLESGGGSTLL